MTESKIERVRVILGIPQYPDQPMMPVTVCNLEGTKIKYIHLPREDIMAIMWDDDVAIWTAKWNGLGWELIERVDNKDPEPVERVTDCVWRDTETPFAKNH